MDDNFGNLKEEFKNPKKRMSFEDRYDRGVKYIESLNLSELKAYRIKQIKNLENLDIIRKEDEVINDDAKRKYFLGLRNLLYYH